MASRSNIYDGMKRLFEAFSPASKPPQTYLQYEDIEGAGKSGEDPSAGFVDAQPLPEYNYDAAPLVSATTDTDRIDRMRKESYRRLETSRAFFADLLRLQNPPSTIEEFVSSLEDGSYIVQLLQKITGMIERPKKLANLGPPGITAENFERYDQPSVSA